MITTYKSIRYLLFFLIFIPKVHAIEQTQESSGNDLNSFITEILPELDVQNCSNAPIKDIYSILTGNQEVAVEIEDWNSAVLLNKYLLLHITTCPRSTQEQISAFVRMVEIELQAGTLNRAKTILDLAKTECSQAGIDLSIQLQMAEAKYLAANNTPELAMDGIWRVTEIAFQNGDTIQALQHLKWGLYHLGSRLSSATTDSIITAMTALPSNTTFISFEDHLKEIAHIQSIHRGYAKGQENKSPSAFTYIFFGFSLLVMLFLYTRNRSESIIQSLNAALFKAQLSSGEKESISTKEKRDSAKRELLANSSLTTLEVNNIMMDVFKRELSQPGIYHSLTNGERGVFAMLVFNIPNDRASEILATSNNSYRVRKSKFIKKIKMTDQSALGPRVINEALLQHVK